MQAWVHLLLLYSDPMLTIAYAVDLGGSLAVASRGLYATGVSTDLNGKDNLLIWQCAACTWRFDNEALQSHI